MSIKENAHSNQDGLYFLFNFVFIWFDIYADRCNWVKLSHFIQVGLFIHLLVA